MRLVANVVVSFVQSGSKKQLKKCVVVIVCAQRDNRIAFMTGEANKRVEYQLTNNIAGVRTRFLSNGKLTLELKRPAIYALLSEAEPISALEEVARVLEEIWRGTQSLSTVKTPQSAVVLSQKDKELLQVTLTIDKVSKFPSGKGYPVNLQTLKLINLKLKKFDNRILYLRSLSVLHMESLLVDDIPKDIHKLKLTSLTISSCRLKQFPIIEPDSVLSQSLRVLDLSENNLRRLPEDLWFCLPNLRSVSLNDNSLEALPTIGLEASKCLHKLDLSNNCLSILPFSFSFVAPNITQCNLNSAFSPKSSIMSHTDFRRKDRFQPACLSQISMLSFLDSVLLSNKSLLTLRKYLPRSLWLKMSVLRLCFQCQKRVGFTSKRNCVDLKSLAHVSFSVDTVEQIPLMCYCCEYCIRDHVDNL